jgi:hypothetical protein
MKLFSSLAICLTFAGASSADTRTVFDVFQEACIPLTEGSKRSFSNDYRKFTSSETKSFINATGSPIDTVLWKSGLPNIVIQTYERNQNYCMVFQSRVAFETIKSAYTQWKTSTERGFRVKNDFEIHKRYRSAGVFLAKQLGSHEFQQVTINYSEKMNDGLAMLVAIRLSEMSPAAAELFPE